MMQQTPKTAAEYQAEMMQLYRRAHPETEVPPTPAAEPPAPEIRDCSSNIDAAGCSRSTASASSRASF